MKKLVLLLTLIAGLSWSGNAQQVVASFGVKNSWGVSSHVSRAVYHDYGGYDWVHTKRYHRGRSLYFDVILQRGDVFVEVTYDNYGHIHKRVSYNYYPLHDHTCGDICGYRRGYNPVVYSRPYYHKRHYHYRDCRRPGYAYPKYRGHGHGHRGHSHGKGRHYHKGRGHGKHYTSRRYDDDDDDDDD